MKNRIKRFKDGDKNEGLHFYCPGCRMTHGIFIKQGPYKENAKGKVIKGRKVPLWKWNGDEIYPTFTPSILVRWDEGMRGIKKRCHSIITFGYIKFLNDSTHHLKNLSVKLPDV